MEKVSARRISTTLLVGIIGAVAVLSIVAGIRSNERWAGYLHLMQKGANCQAVIVKTESGSDCLAEYTFSIEGRTYFGAAMDCSAQTGRQVTVTYLADDPSRSCLGSPGERLANEVIRFLVRGLSFPSLS